MITRTTGKEGNLKRVIKNSAGTIYLILILFLNAVNITGQIYCVNTNTPFKYLAATEEPDSNWFMPGFDDSSWLQDTGTIGYGYFNEDVTIDNDAASLYLRYRFNVTDKSKVDEINISCNYDDGYIAYLNGKKILSVNAGDSADAPAYDDVTVRSHERETYPYQVLGYYFDKPRLDSLLADGQNILAVHVLNDTIGGSDLYFKIYLYNLTGTNYNMYSDLFRYKRQCRLDSTEFPIVVINTDEYGIPYRKIRRKAYMDIIDKGPGKYNKPSDSSNVYSGEVSIEVRGQSSAEYPKRSYRFETIYSIDTLEIDTNVALLGMPEDEDWILTGPFHDKAQFRNSMIYDLGRRLGSYQVRSRYCELIMNGEFLGLYCLTENIKRHPYRVNIARLRDVEISGVDVTGGYIMRLDKDYGDVEIVYPKSDNIQPEQTEYIYSFLDTCMAVLYSNYFTDPDSGFRKYMSDTSLVDYLVMNELTKNADAYLYSTYFYKDRADIDNRIKFGPLWDYDLAFGNTIFQEGFLTYGWQFDFNTRLPVTRILQDVAVVDLFQARWHELRQGMLHTDSVFALIDSIVNYIHEPVQRNYEVWPVISERLFQPYYVSQTYEEEILNIKNWLTERLQWIDDNIDNLYYPVDIYSGASNNPVTGYIGFEAYPNPFTSELSVSFSSSYPGDLKIQLYNLLGQLKLELSTSITEGYKEVKLDDRIGSLPPGIYIMNITVNSKLIGIKKLIRK
jgi:hypothetical protein